MRIRSGAGLAVAALAALLLLFPVIGLALRGGGGAGRSDDGERAADEQAAASDPDPAAASLVRRGVELTLDTREIDHDEYWPPVAVVDELPDVATRLVRVLTHDSVLLRQCALDDLDRLVACAPAVEADPQEWEGDVNALVELRASFRGADGDTIDCRQERCALVVTSDDDGDGVPPVLAGAELVFGTSGRPGTIDLVTEDPVGSGGRVSVSLAGFRPGERLTLGWCAPPGPVDRDACGPPAPTAEVSIGADGQARVELSVPKEGDGPGTRPCSARRPCAVAVVGSGRQAMVAVAPVAFIGAPGPDLSAWRLAVALGLAAMLIAGALLLLRTTDWRDEDDPFEGISLAVPEWDSIILGEEADDDPLLLVPR